MQPDSLKRSLFFDHSRELLAITDGSYFIDLNPAWETTLGFSIEELKSKPFWEFMHPDDFEATKNMVKNKPSATLINRYRTSNGGYRSLAWTGTRDHSTGYGYGVARDITDLLRVERELRESRDDFSTLLSILSHDLKSPLAHIQLFSNMVFEDVKGVMEGSGLSMIERVIQSAKVAISIVNDIHMVSKVTGARKFESVDLSEVIQSVLSNMKQDIELSKAVIVSGAQLPVINGNRFCITQAVANVLANAIKYSKADILPIIDISKHSDSRGDGIVIRDNGIGVDPKHLKDMFEMFRRLTPDKRSGNGAGLGIVSRVAKMHNGHAWAENHPDGLRVYLIFGGADGKQIKSLAG